MQARQKAPDPLQHLGVVEFRDATAPVRADAKGKAGKMVQAVAAQQQWPNHRYFGLHQFARERVLFENLRLAPAARAVKLGHHHTDPGLGFFEVQLVDAVLIRT